MKKYIYLILFIFKVGLSLSQSTLDFDTIQLDEYSGDKKIKNDKIKIVQAIKVSTVDPIFIKDQYSVRVVPYLYDTLFTYNDKGEVVPNLVDTWIWKDDRILELKLKENIQFSNGEELLAIDVKKSIERMLEQGIFKDFFSDIEAVKVISEKSLEIKLKRKNKMFLSMLTYYMCSITKNIDGNLYGTGPYTMEKITNKSISLSRNDTHLKIYDRPKKIEILAEISERKRAILYFNEDVDVVLDATSKRISDWKKEGLINKNIIIQKEKELDTVAIIFGNKGKVFERRNVRKMILSLINRGELIKDIFSGERAKTFFPAELFPAKLSKVLDEKKVILSSEERKILEKEIEIMILNDDQSLKIANNLKAQLQKNGVKAKIIPHQLEAYLMKLEKKDYELAVTNITFDKKYLVYNLGKIIKYDIADREMYNAILPFLEFLKEEKDTVKREQIYDNIVYLISKNVPYIPLIHREKVSINRKFLNN
ncbi:MAG: ABC transporter substrate-binding protein [Cetobacterium sp.]